jgi:hypothetical protein
VYSLTNESMLDTISEHPRVNSILFFPRVNLRSPGLKIEVVFLGRVVYNRTNESKGVRLCRI